MYKRWLMGVLLGVSLLASTATAHAATDVTGDADLQHAVATAPQGIPLDNLFAMSGWDNFTKLIDSPLVDQSIAQITRDNPTTMDVQAGAIWSKTGLTRMNNQFDMSQDTDISMWLYFGNKGSDAGSGMAFVLQNSDDGIWAAASGGQALGVWGNDKNGYSKETVVSSAIQNSWALEFDTRVNSDGGYGVSNAFDKDAVVNSGMHIGSGYPGQADSYELLGTSRKYYASLNHIQPKPVANFADGQWHHLSLSWNATKRQMTYRYNDRDVRTGASRSGMDVVQDTVNIDPSKLNATDEKPNVYWGMTGSTNTKNSENGLVLIDSSDTLGQVTAHATLENTTTHRPVTAGSRVAVGDQLTYRYTFDYDAMASHQDIQPLTMNLPLPQPLTWTAGGVSYNGGAITEPFTATELKRTTIQKKWRETLDKNRHQVTVQVTGTVPPVAHTTTVPEVNARFFGPNYQTQLQLPSYHIATDVALKLTNLGAATQQLGHHEAALVRVRLTNQDQSFAQTELANYQVTGRLNGQQLPVSATWVGQPVGTAELTIPAERLQPGDNQLTLQAQDKANAATVSNPVTVTLNRGPGTLDFAEVSHDADFTTTTLTGTAQRITRQPGWRLSVSDERGTGRRWKLLVRQGEDFQTPSGQPLSGQLLFSWGNQSQPINEMDTLIATHTTASDTDVVDVSGHWQTNEGPLMAINSDTLAGQYHGTLEWRLQDTPG